jgi:hypothetical protein
MSLRQPEASRWKWSGWNTSVIITLRLNTGTQTQVFRKRVQHCSLHMCSLHSLALCPNCPPDTKALGLGEQNTHTAATRMRPVPTAHSPARVPTSLTHWLHCISFFEYKCALLIRGINNGVHHIRCKRKREVWFVSSASTSVSYIRPYCGFLFDTMRSQEYPARISGR